MFDVSGVVNSLNKIVEKLGALIISIGGDDADYVCKLQINSGQSIPNNTMTKVALATKIHDPENCGDTTNYKITITKAGYYAVSAGIMFDNPTASARYYALIKKNGSELQFGGQDQTAGVADRYPEPKIADTFYFEKGDYLELYAFQNSGGAKNIYNNQQTFLSVAKINKYSGGGSQPNGEGWHTVAAGDFLNGWVNYNSNTHYPASYFIDSFGIVHLRGLVKSGTVGQNIFILPAGYRPAKECLFAIDSNNAFGVCIVASSGGVKINAGSNAYCSLEGVTFRADGY